MCPIICTLLGSSETWYNKEGKFSTSYWFYFSFQMITTIFCLYWDYYWDWGLFNGDMNCGHKHLRIKSKMTFSPTFYYLCIIENFILRFWWLFTSAGITFKETEYWVLQKIEFLVIMGVLAELTRRLIWSIIRVENEFHNNYEQYRDILAIPPIKEDE